MPEAFRPSFIMGPELERISAEMNERGISHLFLFFDQDAINFNTLLTKDEASQVIEYLAQTYGGEALDQAVDRLIENESWPDTLKYE